MDRDEYLRDEPHGSLHDVGKRVNLALTNERRIAKAFSWLVNDLYTKKVLSLEDVNRMLEATKPYDQ